MMSVLAMKILSVHLSVKRLICDKPIESCAHILILHQRPLTPVFFDKKNG